MKIFWGAVAALTCIPGVAAAQDFDGPRIEARVGYETPTVSGDGDVFKIGSAVSYGAEIGYDMKVSESIVAGPYVTYEFSGVELCDGGTCLEVDGNLGVGARLGYIVGSQGLLYAKLGYASMKISARVAGFSGSDTQGGVQGAIGYEMNFGKQFYGKLEGNYGDYGSFVDGFNLQRRQLVAGFGVRF